jgi:hypothetical protein
LYFQKRISTRENMMMSLHAANITIHVTAASFALLVGLASLFSVKGGATHRRAGKYLLPAAVIAATTAIIGIIVDPSRPALTAITISATYQLVSGMRALWLRGARDRPLGLLDAMITIFGLSAALWLLLTMGPGTPSFTPAIGYSAVGYVTLLSCYDLSRFAWQALWKRKVWPIDHGLKMVGFYFALVSAAAGNLLRDFQPWSQVIPSAVGVIALIIFAVFFFRITSATATI